MSRIHVMDELLANKIAAGEVVERCASVVKELVENSIDAKSTEIRVILEEAGTKKICVIDNGIGMDREDAVLAFGRHATSKLKNEADLFRIETLGFRGEALASIASVSNINLKTSDGIVGTEANLRGGKIESVTSADLRKGTSITVSDLFYNTPARLKHMKSLYTELASTVEYINKIALSHPEIKFTLENNDNVLVKTDGSGQLLKTIKDIYGISTVRKMIPISGSDRDYDVSGYISLPEVHRSSRNHMVTLVNGRVVRNSEINKTINDAYHSYKPDTRYPIVVINIELDPSLVDVNIHPTKMDVKFSKIEELKTLIYNLIRHELEKGTFIPDAVESDENPSITVPPDTEKSFDTVRKPVYVEQKISFDMINDDSDEYVLISDSDSSNSELFKTDDFYKTEDSKEKIEPKKERFPEMYPVGVVHGTYIVCQSDKGMYLIDQHAAKERCNYELFKEEMGHPTKEKTAMLFPFTEEFNASEFIVLKENFDVLRNIGFEIEEFGVNSIIIKAHPVWLNHDNIEEAIRSILEIVIKMEKNFSVEKFNESVATLLSCKKAIKANDFITMAEVEKLISDLGKCKNPFHCPHGRPTTIFYSNYDLEKLFKRSGF